MHGSLEQVSVCLYEVTCFFIWGKIQWVKKYILYYTISDYDPAKVKSDKFDTDYPKS